MTVLTQCVLHVGSKTITHCFLALFKLVSMLQYYYIVCAHYSSNRFRSLFLDLVNTDEAKLICLKNVAEFYACNPQVCTLYTMNAYFCNYSVAMETYLD